MPYAHTNSRGQTYYLHGKEVTLQNGRAQRISYFAREATTGGTLDALPAGKEVIENPRTGLPFLKGAAPVPAAETPAPRGAKTATATQRPSTKR